ALLSNRDQNNVIRLDTINDLTIEISGNSPEIGNVKEQLNIISMEGEEVKISFSSRYMLDTLKTIDSNQVKIDFSGAMRPFVIRTTEQDKILQLILPVRTFSLKYYFIKRKLFFPKGFLLFWRCGNLSLIKTPLMEYTRFPQAATRPPRAFSSLGVSLRPFLLQES